jgi:hypothetical protein
MRALNVITAILLMTCAVVRAQELGAKPPEGAVVLFDGSDTSHWKMKDGADCKWKVVDGALEVTAKTGDIFTTEKFGDCTLHVEFRTPEPAPDDKGQHRGNSGIFLQNTYEIQVLESFGLEPTKGDCGSVYNIKAPDKNMAKKPLEWQSYDITYKAPRFDADGKKIAPARVTLVWNGEKVQDDVEIPHATRNANLPEPKEPAPLQLQDHGFAVQFRNIWVVPAKSEQPKAEKAAAKTNEIVLFDGKDSSQWTAKDGSPCHWSIEKGELVAQKGDIMTKQKFKDFSLHVEYWLTKSPEPESTNRSKHTNSGVYLQGRYEIQILDSYGLAPLTYQDSGGVYNVKAPDVNASLPVERWQSMDITFRAARYDGSGKKTENARVSVVLNDTPIQKDVEITDHSKAGDAEGQEDGPIRLQYHTGAVRFRNVRITPS